MTVSPPELERAREALIRAMSGTMAFICDESRDGADNWRAEADALIERELEQRGGEFSMTFPAGVAEILMGWQELALKANSHFPLTGGRQ